ncbi:MAG: helix-turn-helix domain-containing protein [Candidatus Hydrogenedentes bacterium]|nr:helix-turn-helix domain-containing protein [Candidatus Hydrogenedentota bacterium]
MTTERNELPDTLRMVSPSDAAKILNVAPITLAKWRCTKTGPQIPYTKYGRYVRYSIRDLVQFLESNKVTG